MVSGMSHCSEPHMMLSPLHFTSSTTNSKQHDNKLFWVHCEVGSSTMNVESPDHCFTKFLCLFISSTEHVKYVHILFYKFNVTP